MLKLLTDGGIKKLSEKLKNPKALLALGLAGIVAIGLSSILPDFSKRKQKSNGEFDCVSYQKSTEEDVLSIVKGITGDRRATVVITLKNGIRYSYADDIKDDKNVTDGEKTTQTSSRKETNHITIKGSSGEEKALVITENMPEIRGVAIVCSGGNNENTANEIRSAVMAALDITAKRIYITERQ